MTYLYGNIPRWFTHPQTVTHPSTNQGRRRVTTLIEINALPLSHATNTLFGDAICTHDLLTSKCIIMNGDRRKDAAVNYSSLGRSTCCRRHQGRVDAEGFPALSANARESCLSEREHRDVNNCRSTHHDINQPSFTFSEVSK